MAVLKTQQTAAEELARESLDMVAPIASYLHRRYGWVAQDDLGSYAYLGLVKAAQVYRPERGVPFEKFAFRKAAFAAVDEMRKDGVLKRNRDKPRPSTVELSQDMPDPSGSDGLERVERKDMCRTLLGGLNKTDRQLLLMYYADQMTFKEIGKVFDISESAVCLRHKAIIERLGKASRAARG